MQILIVEDSLKMRGMIRSLVAPFAAAVFECDKADEAVSAYQKHEPDWVLMDIRLKESDGIEATARICSTNPKARVVIVTGFDDVDLRAAAREAGAIGYVMKENLVELRRMLNQPQF